jgi:outer membrane usher protein FimD/PapC
MIRPGTTRYSLAAGRYRNQGRRAEALGDHGQSGAGI